MMQATLRSVSAMTEHELSVLRSWAEGAEVVVHAGPFCERRARALLGEALVLYLVDGDHGSGALELSLSDDRVALVSEPPDWSVPPDLVFLAELRDLARWRCAVRRGGLLCGLGWDAELFHELRGHEVWTEGDLWKARM